MAGNLELQGRHGKSRVRVARVWRRPAAAGGDVIAEWNVAVSVVSDCLPSYTSSDNSAIVATDSIKNTVRSPSPSLRSLLFLLRRRRSGSAAFFAAADLASFGQVYVKAKECTEVVSMEEFAVILGRHFTSLYPQVQTLETCIQICC